MEVLTKNHPKQVSAYGTKHRRGSLGQVRDRLSDSAPPNTVSRDKSVKALRSEAVTLLTFGDF